MLKFLLALAAGLVVWGVVLALLVMVAAKLDKRKKK